MSNYDVLDLHYDPSSTVLDVLDDIDGRRPLIGRVIRTVLRVDAWCHDRVGRSVL